jgi:hypothetical protein
MPKGQKKDDRSQAEKTLDERQSALREKIKKAGGTATDAQKAELKDIAAKLRPLKFVRIANKRIPRCLASIKGIGALGSYAPSDAQKTAIVKALTDAMNAATDKLGGKKEVTEGFSLPTT